MSHNRTFILPAIAGAELVQALKSHKYKQDALRESKTLDSM